MNKISLIIQREYLSRVRKKSFLLVTFLVPVFFIALYAGIFYLTKKSFEDTHATVFVLDQQGGISEQLENNRNITYSKSNVELQEQISEIKGKKDNINILIIPADFYSSKRIELLSSGKPNMSTQNEVKSNLTSILQAHQYSELGVDPSIIRDLDSNIRITSKELTETGDTKDSDTRVAMGISIALAFLVYLSLFLYGTQVMRGIIEEKSSRIVEVIISSVKPFQLMMGKIVGIGLVGLTQFLLWVILSAGLLSAASLFMDNSKEMAASVQTTPGMPQTDMPETAGGFDLDVALGSIDFPELLICFFLFFLAGYLLYSALFAAVGSAVDNETETNQFMMPITMPLLLAYALSFGVIVNDPHGSIATWLSFIPLTSPIAMLVRIPFDVPLWQIVTSFALLVLGFIFTTWVAARIYRVGILMYGKKVTFKELIKWFNYKR
ncbi:ABC transporter permease [Sphingobacterium corticibacter]|uniref:ABC transporter permease n=1 Tax=Sphingobacterium corticibacter TaxID=2171749 RepID=A0A2T8HMI3_9SPHI|nr:ABC transporter permease [Sphingobacterium corticibacter]PVH26658.1 ABC transporter permease [Sphingobacterium corticibacter]